MDEKNCFIPSVNVVLSQKWQHCVQYTKHHQLSAGVLAHLNVLFIIELVCTTCSAGHLKNKKNILRSTKFGENMVVSGNKINLVAISILKAMVAVRGNISYIGGMRRILCPLQYNSRDYHIVLNKCS